MEHDNQTIRQFLCPFGFEPPDYVWKKMHLRTVPAKAVLVLAGSNLNAIDILLQGEIHVVNSFSDGKEFGYTNERSLTLLGDIEYFSGVKQYASSVIAKTTVTLAELDLESFQYWFDCDKLFRDHVVAHIAQKAYKMAGRFGTEKYEDAIYRLTKTILDYLPGIIVRCYNLSITELPLDGNAEEDIFKVYMRDCGLFVSMLEDGTQYDILQGNLYGYKGAIFENLIADVFGKMGRKLYYFHKDSGLEVDFVIRYKGQCTLVEVKASTGNTKSTRTILRHPEKYHVSQAIKLGDYNVGRTEQLLTLPLYMAFLLKEL